jgi:hypothetical protein
LEDEMSKDIGLDAILGISKSYVEPGMKFGKSLVAPAKNPDMPVTPTKDSQEIARAALEAKQAARMRAGRASTILTGPSGDLSTAPGAVKNLLGQ